MDRSSNTNADRAKARWFALVMHALFVVLIVAGVSWQKKPEMPVQAELWSKLPPLPQPPQPKVAEAPPPEPVPPKPAPRVVVPPVPPPAPKVAPTPAPKPEIALKKAPEKKAEPKPEPRPEAKAEPKKREEDKLARLQKEAEDKARREQDQQRELAEREAKAAADKAAAEKATAERAAKAAAARELQKYINGIYGRIWARVAVPPDVQGSPEAVFEVSLFPGGELANVAMRKSSGNAAYDAALERAIRQAQPFVVPSGDLFHGNFRPVILSFRPR